MEIIWKNLKDKRALYHERKINLEYAVRLQVVRILIKEAEHLMDYLSLVVVQIDPGNGNVSIHRDTPEPLYSKIANNLEQPVARDVFTDSSSLSAAVNA
ncbi:hypothetical protein [Flagellimonas sp.]|uniref:hypothetical protein n=1 Tax=Flagellimonas sp. TaxID=2058762 RepID=UPI003BA973A4